MRIVIACACFAGLSFAQASFVAEGQLIGGGTHEGFSVEVSEGGGKMSQARASVHADSSFRIELPAGASALEFRVLNYQGEVIHVSHQWPRLGAPIELRLPNARPSMASQAAVSMRRLSFRPTSPSKRAFAQSQRLKMAGKKAEAMAAMREIVKTEPAWFEAWVELGSGQATLGDSVAAADSLGKALAIDPNAAEIYPSLSFALLRSGRIPEATRIAQKGLDLKPDSLKSKFVLGLAMASAGPPSLRAVALLEESQGQFPEAMLPLATLQLRLGQLEASRDTAWRYLHIVGVPHSEMAASIWQAASLSLRFRENR